jgi:large subunit ribosomal protein L25
MSLILNVEKRDLTKKFPKANKVESKTELLRGVFYGKKEVSTPISIPYVEFKKIWKETGSSSLIVLKGIGEDKEVVIQDMDIDPVSGRVRHVDFYVIERGKVMEADILLEFIGESPAMKELGGTLVKVLHELKIEVLPGDLPKDIKVDLSLLKTLESKIFIKDLILPSSAKAIDDVDEVVALIAVAEEEAEAEVSGAPDLADIEIEKKGKKEEEQKSEGSEK